jgi:hemoglobin
VSTSRDRTRLPIVEQGSTNTGDEADSRAVERTSNPDPLPTSGARNDGLRDVEEADLHGLLTAFYETVETEPLLAPYFAVVDMAAHMPRIVDFWSTLLWHTGRYSGNAFRPHLEMAGLTGEHFRRWLVTLERTVDERFAGPSAERLKAMGHRIAYSMQLRLGITPFEDYRADLP